MSRDSRGDGRGSESLAPAKKLGAAVYIDSESVNVGEAGNAAPVFRGSPHGFAAVGWDKRTPWRPANVRSTRNRASRRAFPRARRTQVSPGVAPPRPARVCRCRRKRGNSVAFFLFGLKIWTMARLLLHGSERSRSRERRRPEQGRKPVSKLDLGFSLAASSLKSICVRDQLST